MLAIAIAAIKKQRLRIIKNMVFLIFIYKFLYFLFKFYDYKVLYITSLSNPADSWSRATLGGALSPIGPTGT